MAELTIGERKKGRQFAARLEELAYTAPDPFTESRVHRLVAKLRQRYGWSWQLKRQAVVRFLRDRRDGDEPRVTCAEIVTHFEWDRDDVKKILDELVGESVIRLEKYRPVGFSGRGRPPRYYRHP